MKTCASELFTTKKGISRGVRKKKKKPKKDNGEVAKEKKAETKEEESTLVEIKSDPGGPMNENEKKEVKKNKEIKHEDNPDNSEVKIYVEASNFSKG